jgi:hypothetical protein
MAVMKTLKQSNDYLPETWKGLKPSNGEHSASATCANGHTCTLTDHTIADDGTVTPSLVCPYDDCNWHENVKLEGWNHAG